MGRNVLFRGKRLDSGEWVEGHFFQIWERTYILWGTTNGIPNMVEVAPTTVGQYTGLTDKNGKKIFEGDIIRWVDWRNTTHEAPVRYDPEWNRFCVWLNGAESMGVNRHLSKDIEVIGNIHDNPELMGADEAEKDDQ